MGANSARPSQGSTVCRLDINFVFTPTKKVASTTFREKKNTPMLFVLNCHDFLWSKRLVSLGANIVSYFKTVDALL